METSIESNQPEGHSDSPVAVSDWEDSLSRFLDDLSTVQTDLLKLLEEKRRLLVAKDREGLHALQAEETRLADRLTTCQQQRQGLLAAAADSGLPSRDLATLADALPAEKRAKLQPRVQSARHQGRLLQHHSLTNWVLVQRTLLHLSQMVEIIATGGQKPPTYQKSGTSAAGGALVDRAV